MWLKNRQKAERSVGAVILAGGAATRMGGEAKDGLLLEGATFLQRILRQLDGYGEVLLSADRADRFPGSPVPVVVDRRPGCGPLGGLAAALGACRSDALLAVSIDLPLFERGLGEYLQAFFDDSVDAAATVDRGGRLHPLCAIYGKSALAVFEDQLTAGNFRLRDALARLRLRQAPLAHSAYADAAVTNVNTPEQYAELRRSLQGPPVLAVSGVKNSGKTTLLTRVLPLLVEAGLRVGVIKHDAHRFQPDVPETDSFRLRQAGAERVAVYSDDLFMIAGAWRQADPDALLERFGDMDLVLMEGQKYSPLPKIEVVRRGNSSSPVCDPATLIALATDGESPLPGVASYDLNDYRGLADRIVAFWRNGR